MTIEYRMVRIKALGKESNCSRVRPEDEGISGNQDPLWAFQKAKKIFLKQAFFNNIKYKANKMILEIHEYIPVDYI